MDQGGEIQGRQPTKKNDYRVPIWLAWIFLVIAICFDLLEMFGTYTGIGAVLAEILSIVGGFAFWLGFQLCGVSMSSNTKRFTVAIVAYIIEIIPGFDAIPILSWATVNLFVFEDIDTPH